MAGAYATLASGGVRHRPTGIERVVFPDGKSEKLGSPKGKRVMTDGQAYEVTRILGAEHPVRNRHLPATAVRPPARPAPPTRPRTRGSWATRPSSPAAVWVGYPDAGVAMPGAQGGTYAGAGLERVHDARPRRLLRLLPQPTEPFQASPFFGKYASTGGANTGSYYDYSSDGGYTEDPDSGTGTGDTGDTSTGGGQYDPNLYESAWPHRRASTTRGCAPPGTGSTGADG